LAGLNFVKATVPARKICDLCAELDIDLLVIGSHGYNALFSFLGSTTNAVMHEINCDVLTVRIKT
jgi:universal stress protein A